MFGFFKRKIEDAVKPDKRVVLHKNFGMFGDSDRSCRVTDSQSGLIVWDYDSPRRLLPGGKVEFQDSMRWFPLSGWTEEELALYKDPTHETD